MTSPVSGIDSDLSAVLARIAQIQAQFAPAIAASPVAAAPSVSTGAATTSGSTFASTLSQLSASGASGGSALDGGQVVASAKKYLGVPYVWGGTTRAGLDCSGLVQKAYGDLGISLPRLSQDQARTGTAVPSLAQAQPGDLLGFGNPAHHIAIYLGNNQMIAAPQTGENVQIQSVYETPASIRRIIASSADPSASSAGAVPGAASSAPGISAAVAQYSNLFSENESQYGLPTGLLAAVAQTESGGNPSAVSPAGAQGLMQLMPTTAAGLGVNPWDPSQSVQGAAKLLSNYLNKYQSVPLALAAYNAGPGAVAQYGGVPPYSETQNYVTKITGLMAGATA